MVKLKVKGMIKFYFLSLAFLPFPIGVIVLILKNERKKKRRKKRDNINGPVESIKTQLIFRSVRDIVKNTLIFFCDMP